MRANDTEPFALSVEKGHRTLANLRWAVCRCHGCKTRNINGQVWEKHPDGKWRKGRGIRLPHYRTTTQKGNK